MKDNVLTTENKQKLVSEIGKHSMLTAVACLSHIAMADGTVDHEEDALVDRVIQSMSEEYRAEAKDIFTKITKNQDKELAHQYLMSAREYLTGENIKSLFGLALTAASVDGEITQKEKECIQEMLLIVGLPKNALDDAMKN